MLTTEGEREELLALMADMNHAGETAGAWPALKTKLRRLLDGARAINAAFDAGIAENAAAQRRFERAVLEDADRLAADREADSDRNAQTSVP